MFLKNAGILFRIRNKTKCDFLIAQEEFVEGYKNGGTWSALEGGPENDETPVACAAREATEESMGVILSKEELLQKLEDQTTHEYRLVVSGKSNQEFCLFVIDLDESFRNVCDKFDDLRKKMLMVKDKIYKFDQLALKFSNYLPVVGRRFDDTIFLDLFHIHECFKKRNCGWLHYNGLHEGIASQQIKLITFKDQKEFADYIMMVKLWNEIKNEACKYKQILKPRQQDNFAISYDCVPCFMEKRKMQWIDSNRLWHAIHRQSTMKFRYSFTVLYTQMFRSGAGSVQKF